MAISVGPVYLYLEGIQCSAMAKRVLLVLALLCRAAAGLSVSPQVSGIEKESLLGTIFFNQVGLAHMIEKQANTTEAVSDGMARMEEALTKYLDKDSSFSREMAVMRTSVENMTSVVSSYIHMGESAITRENVTGHILVKLRDQEETIKKIENENEEIKTENQQLKEEKQMLRTENVQLRAEVLQTEEEMRKVKEEVRKVEEDKRKADEDRRKAEEDKRKKEDDQRRVEEDRRRTQEDKRKISEENSQLLDQVRQLHEENRKRDNETEAIQQDLKELQEENENLQSVISLLEGEKEALEDKISVLEGSNVTEAGGECGGDNSEVQELERKIRALEEENGKLKETLKNEMRPSNCEAHFCKGALKDAVYEVFPSRNEGPATVWCDMSSSKGGWTMFLKRQQQTIQENFARPWEEYRNGFGDVDAEHWLGLEHLHKMTSAAPMVLRLEVKAFDGASRWAEWDTFSVAGSDTQYKLTVAGYSANSTLGDPLTFSRNISGMAFSTLDRDNDKLSLDCVEYYSSGGGWWYASCSDIKPTAPLTSSGRLNTLMSMWWSTSYAQWTSLREVKLMFRPRERSEFCTL
ncbi:angiopoietin-related protein 7-like isoform X2 [Penaeus chinensis]|uniref:angiopoietin-related protein 7-like isoform X2 n=1 Tax=Penaeus chinensis TaxID=139456 RepID=UPI001FB72DC4|nr:angiopoietin-related protein 7-like isoform X2 [Penaeus chinensis]